MLELQKCHHIKLLHISGDKMSVTSEALNHVIENNDLLEWVRLEGDAVTDETCKALALLPHIEIVDLRNAALTSDGIAAFRGHPHLEELIVFNSRVSASAILALANNKSLRKMTLWDTGIPITERRALINAFPHCKVAIMSDREETSE
jgi:hypothetical protein